MKRIVKTHADLLYIYSDKKDMAATRIIKSLSGRRFHGTPQPHWTAPLTLDSVLALESAGFELSTSAQKWKNVLFFKPEFDPDFYVSGLNGVPKQYQLEGIQMIDQLNGNCLLADDPGLGKSMQVIAWCHWRKKQNILIFCPSFAKHNWEDEIIYWTDEQSIQIINGMQETEIWGRYVIVNYDILIDRKELDVREDLFDVDWDVCIIDESHYISNPEAGRTLAAKALAAGVPHIIPISATPGKNRPADLFTSINLANPNVFPSFHKFGHKYCGPKMVRGKWEFKGSSNELELFNLLSKTVMIRRTKEEVFPQLPKRVRIPILLEGGKEVDCSDLSLNAFERMKQAAVKAKMNGMIEFIKNMLETEDKLIVFGEHKITIDAIYLAFEDIAVRVDGTVSSIKKRKEAVYKFQRCARCGVKKEFHGRDAKACVEYVPDLSTRLFIGSRAAKEANTLTAAHHTIFTELWWSEKDHWQAEGRAYGRAGDLHGTINWYLIAKGTIEEKIVEIISLKERNMAKILDGKPMSKEHILSELIKKYKNN